MPVLDRFRLDGKVAVVTGASSGLGAAFAVVDVWEGRAIEAAIAAGGAGAGLAAALTLIRWVLLAVIAVAVAVMLWRGGRGTRARR